MPIKSHLFPQSPPIVKWVGGKRWLIPKLRQIVQAEFIAHPCWTDALIVDLFAGGASIPLGLGDLFKHVTVNDINPHLINLYNCVQVENLTKSPVEFGNCSEDFYRARTQFNANIDRGEIRGGEMAGLFYYLCKTAYNGLCRISKSGKYNTPFGHYKSIEYATDFLEFAATIEDWTISKGDFDLVTIGEPAFIYADPPYWGKDVFTGYASTPFGWDEQVRLANWLSEQQGIMVASNYPDPAILELYGSLGFEIEFVTARCTVAASVAARGKRQEMLAIKRNWT